MRPATGRPRSSPLKGVLVSSFAIILVTGLVASVGLFVAATWGPWWEDDPLARRAIQWTAPAVFAWVLVMLAQGLNRAAKDMRGIVVTKQLTMPLVLLVGAGVAVGLLGMDVLATIVLLAVATGVSGVLGLVWAWRHYRVVLTDRTLAPSYEVRKLLAFSIPQSLTQAAFRLNISMDVLMLGWLSSREEVGLYAIAAALAGVGAVPANAVTSIFSPFIAELVYVKELARLDQLLKTVTRWLLIVATPGYLVLFLLPDLVLGIYDPVYMASLTPLVLLVAAQLLNTLCVPAMNTIPMAGYSMLNFINGLVALGLNIGLNAWLIPEYGSIGAAVATGSTLVLWSGWRLLEVRHLLRCFPFGGRTLGLLAVALGGAASIHAFAAEASMLARVGATGGLVLVFVASAATFGRTPDDTALLLRARDKLKGLLGRR